VAGYKIKTVDDLIEGKKIAVSTVIFLPRHFQKAKVMIFDDLETLERFIADVISPKIDGKELGMGSYFICSPYTVKNDFRLMNVTPSEEKCWLVVRNDDFNKIIRPALDA
jgi:hypothetical protein